VWRELREEVEDELSRLRRSLEESEPRRADLLAHGPDDQLDSWDRGAAAANIHEVYSGMENLLKRVAKVVDKQVPDGQSWHKDLLGQLAMPTGTRPAAISGPLYERLVECLALRHIARTHYGFQLEWRLLRPHLERLHALVDDFAAEMRAFIDEMGRRGGTPASEASR
jgi:hypothetical protein